MASLNTNAGIIEASQGWKCLWKKPRLHLFGNLEFVCCTAFGFQLLRGGAPLLFYRLRHLIETDQREGIPVDIFEAGEHSAPNRSLLSKQQRRSVSSLVSRLLLILDAPKAWNVAKANSASSPLAIRGHDIFGDKSNLRRLADQLIFIRIGIRCDQRKHRGAVWWRNPNPALPGLKSHIKGQIKSKLFHVESKASVLIANVDVDRVNAKVGIIALHEQGGLIRQIEGWGTGHRRYYKTIRSPLTSE